MFLNCHVGGGVAGGEGVEVGDDHCFSAVVAEGGFVASADDGEGVEDVGGVFTGEAGEADRRMARWGGWLNLIARNLADSLFDALAFPLYACARIRALRLLSCPRSVAGRVLGRGV